MKSLTSFCAIVITGLTLAAPTHVFAGNHRGYCAPGGNFRGGGSAVFVSGGARGFYGSSFGYRSYCAPVAIRRPYCAPRPWFYGGPAISVGFVSSPGFYNDYGYYNSYPTRTVYRGRPVTGYRENARYDDDLAVDVQRALARRGFYRGAIDGDVGPGTRAAIRSYQYANGYEVTGRIDGTLIRSLRLS